MGDRTPAIVGIQAVVEADAVAEPLDAAIRRLTENSATRWTSQAVSLPSLTMLVRFRPVANLQVTEKP